MKEVKEQTDVKPELNQDTPTEEILKNSPDAQEEVKSSSESSADEQQADKTGEVDKTQVSAEEQEAKEEESLLAKNQPIPYDRFKKIIDSRNELRKKAQEFEKERQELYSDPDVLRVVLKKNGFNEKEISEYLKNQGFEAGGEEKKDESQDDVSKQLSDLTKDLDLSTTEGWSLYQYRIAQRAAEDNIKKALAEYQKREKTEKENKAIVEKDEKEAREISEKMFKIPFGESPKDNKNLNTAVGKIYRYLETHPQHIGLGHTTLLRLALSEEGFKLGERKGKESELKRQSALKSAAVESNETNNVDESNLTPADMRDWSSQRIIEWNRKYGKQN